MVEEAVAVGARQSWRDRARSAATRDIMRTARGLVAQAGIEGLTVRAVARELGVTSPAIYRYFESHEELVDAVVVEIFDDLAGHVQGSVKITKQSDPVADIMRASRELRSWALAHPYEFHLMMVTPLHMDVQKPALKDARYRFARVFGTLFAALWAKGGVPTDWAHETSPDVLETVGRFREQMQIDIPLDAVALFLRCWVRLYGVICMEVMGQLRFLGDESGVFFEAELGDLAKLLNATPA